jgi:murein L,D-transpeptidase YcbB/YkuD
MPPRFRSRTFLILLSLALAAGCKFRFGGDDTADANKLIGEANTAIVAADKMSADAYSKFRSYMDEQTMGNFPGNREQIRPTAQESADLFARSAAAYREQVVSKFEGASKLNINDKFKEYIVLKVEAFKKLADSKDVAKELALVPLDPSLTTQDALYAKVKEVDARLNAVTKEMQEVNDRANKIQQDNPDIIGKPQL